MLSYIAVHILSADLTLRKRTMQPLKSMIYGLRRFDVDRTAAAMGGQVQGSVQGYMTPKTKVYLVSLPSYYVGRRQNIHTRFLSHSV